MCKRCNVVTTLRVNIRVVFPIISSIPLYEAVYDYAAVRDTGGIYSPGHRDYLVAAHDTSAELRASTVTNWSGEHGKFL
eukprot:3321603-Pyramimonas_sp.AAC.2